MKGKHMKCQKIGVLCVRTSPAPLLDWQHCCRNVDPYLFLHATMLARNVFIMLVLLALFSKFAQNH